MKGGRWERASRPVSWNVLLPFLRMHWRLFTILKRIKKGVVLDYSSNIYRMDSWYFDTFQKSFVKCCHYISVLYPYNLEKNHFKQCTGFVIYIYIYIYDDFSICRMEREKIIELNKRVKPTVSIVFLNLTSTKQHLKHKSLLFIKPYMFWKFYSGKQIFRTELSKGQIGIFYGLANIFFICNAILVSPVPCFNWEI